MDEVRRFRFFLPVAVYIMAVVVISPETFSDMLKTATALTEDSKTKGLEKSDQLAPSTTPEMQPAPSEDKSAKRLDLIPMAALLTLGATFAIGLGFVISTVVHAFLHFLGWCCGAEFRVQVDDCIIQRFNKLAGTEQDFRATVARDTSFVACSAFQHSAPEPLKEWLGRRWEMVILSSNAIGAIAFAVATASIGYANSNEVKCVWPIAIIVFAVLLFYCARRSSQEIGAMTKYLAYSSRWKWTHLQSPSAEPIAVLPVN